MSVLPKVSEKSAINYDYFPTAWQAVLWRNYGYVPLSRIAKVLKTSETELEMAAELMGLESQQDANEIWLKRGYLTIIRNNWHLLSYEQILTLLDISDEELAFILKEDDFLWVKLGCLKPSVTPPQYAPLTETELERTKEIKNLFKNRFSFLLKAKDNGFEFLKDFYLPTSGEFTVKTEKNDSIRMVYPYFALYGDILLDEQTDHLPDRLLEEYAKVGVNGIWLQGILYQLAEFPFDKSISKGWQTRINTLNKLVQKAKKYGIGIYLYLNEPRSMSADFFNKFPNLKGTNEGDFYSMCTSEQAVKDYLYNGVRALFQSVPDLAGYFSITMSENLTNCYSRIGAGTEICPKCKERNIWEVVAEVNNLMAKGAHDANPNAKTIVWTWGWFDSWCQNAVALLNEEQIVQSNSEKGVQFTIGGVNGQVDDYSMSVIGPGDFAKKIWSEARKIDMPISAKIQVNTTWQMAAVPYIPVFDLIEKHINNLKNEGVTHFQASWTLGGYPAPNIKFLQKLMSENISAKEFLNEWYGNDVGQVVYDAQKCMSSAFENYPFSVEVVYFGPHNSGPMSPFFLNSTNYEATMVGYPYDDLKKWADIYPVDIYANQYKLLCDEWQKGVDLLEEIKDKNQKTKELYAVSYALLCHFKSALNHILFVKNRDENNFDEALLIVRNEIKNVEDLIKIRLLNSKIGYESSTHYFYTLQDLKEKLINLAHLEEKLKNE